MPKQLIRCLHCAKLCLFALSLLLPCAELYATDTLATLSPASPLKRKPSFKKDPSHKRYDFIRYGSNRLFFANQVSGLASFRRFFEKVDSLWHHATGKVRIVHFGGSHVQADVWTGQVRRRLREWKPDCEGERGFIFPQKLGRSNGSPNFRVDYTGHWRAHRHTKHTARVPVGVSGVAVSTTDSLAELEIILTGSGWLDYPYPQYLFKHVKVFHNAEDTTYIVRLADPSLRHQRFVDRTAGYTAFTFEEALSSVRFEFVKQHNLAGEFVLRGLLLEHDKPGFSYSAIGVNGATVRSYLGCTLLGKELAILNPDLIVFSIGVNDTRGKHFNAQKFEAEYEQLLQIVKSAVPHAAIIFITNSDNLTRRRAPNFNTLPARDVILRLAQRHNAAVWDLFEVMGGLRSFAYWQQAKLAKRDRVHFNHDGYLLLGNLFFDALINAYENYRNTESVFTKH